MNKQLNKETSIEGMQMAIEFTEKMITQKMSDIEILKELVALDLSGAEDLMNIIMHIRDLTENKLLNVKLFNAIKNFGILHATKLANAVIEGNQDEVLSNMSPMARTSALAQLSQISFNFFYSQEFENLIYNLIVEYEYKLDKQEINNIMGAKM